MLQIGQRVSYAGDTRPAWVGTVIAVYQDPPNATPMYKVAYDDGSEGVHSDLVLEVLDGEAILLGGVE